MIETAVYPIDDQPISSTFFNEGRWLTDFITPDNPDIKRLYRQIKEKVGHYREPGVPGYDAPHKEGITPGQREEIEALWYWVASQVRYVPFVKASLNIEGLVSSQVDYWMDPAMVARVRVGNCANKSFLLASLVRNALSAPAVHVALGNLHQQSGVSGHAWVEIELEGRDYIVETTREDMNPFVPSRTATRYEAVIYANDQEVRAVSGRTAIKPFAAVYADWLKEYLDWAYIEGRK